jgi:hypothetical protein
MSSKKIAVLLIVALVLGALSFMTACNAQPQTIIQTVVVEKEVEKVVEKQVTVEVEKEVQVEVVVTQEVEKEVLVEVQGAIPYPESIPLNIEGVEVNRQPISEILTYKALPEYNQPEWMDALVADGTLPPVEERLPEEPQVLLKSGLVDGIGVYGDSWRDFSACPTAGWNYQAGVSHGWFGIEAMSSNYNALVKTGPLYRADQDIEPFPNLAMSWEWSEDGK